MAVMVMSAEVALLEAKARIDETAVMVIVLITGEMAAKRDPAD
ncbi:hypothetical protein Pvag_pPag30078 (plasmid) [Pantoea vagans C9-1]|jgi:hypothetical protein|nr:hypothetical protein Pvag_pPag30078 [Pantoea vagans C9-1]